MILVCSAGCSLPRIPPGGDFPDPGLDPPLPNASMFRWQADFNRVLYDIPRAVQQLHWGLAAVRLVPRSSGEGEIVRAKAVLPNGHEANMAAWKLHHGTIVVAVRVGHFGDSRHEEAFVAQLAKVLRGKPSRRHRQEFELP